ncbi:MAG TPA: hypothetical protein VFB06_34810 [Streptosporangiaceae bacterium]|nr:hypothetical protein [Streptosporangiaceae bacterium]
MDVAVGACLEIQVRVQPGGPQLQLGERADVAGQHGLLDAAVQGRDSRGRSWQGDDWGAGAAVQLGDPFGERGEERVDVLAGVRDTGERQRVQGDGPVGPARLGRDHGQLAAEHLTEHLLVQPGAQPVGVHQRVVHVPQHEQAHARLPMLG